MKTYRVYQVDAFTKERFRGNPAGVVPNAEGLTEAQKELLEKYDECQNELSAKTEKNAFVQGFCLGMRLLAAATYTQTGE